MIRQLFIYFLLFFASVLVSQNKPNESTTFETQFATLLDSENYIGILKLFKEFQQRKKVSALENQIFFASVGKYYSAIRRKEDALLEYEKSIQYATQTAKSLQVKAKVYERIADINFTFQDYKKANKYAQLAEKLTVKDNYFDYINVHSILGYNFFKENKLQKCANEYNLVHQLILEKKDFCKEPEILMKIAVLKDKFGNFNEAMIDIQKCLETAKKCNIGVYIPSTLKSKYDILKNNKKFEEAILVSEKINSTIDSLGFRKQNQKIYEMQLDFERKIKEKENNLLKILDQKKSNLVSKQKWALFIAIVGILILLSLALFLYKLSNQRKKTNKIIEQNNKELARLNLLNQKIFSVISHDFKGPITTLRAYLETNNLVETQNSKFANYLSSLNSQLEQSDAMLNSLLDWAKIELNSTNSNNQQTSIIELVKLVENQLKFKFLEKNINLISHIASNELIDFQFEVAVIVLRNILSNAIKFSYPKSKIEIGFENNYLEIRDFGDGIDEENFAKLFVNEVNPDIGTNKEVGFGIGMYLSNELMRKNGGAIHAKNHVAGGCSFYMNFKANEISN